MYTLAGMAFISLIFSIAILVQDLKGAKALTLPENTVIVKQFRKKLIQDFERVNVEYLKGGKGRKST